jgi:hypothetical protein
MASRVQLLRRVGGIQQTPAGGGLEGELALYFPGAAGQTAKPTLYGFDGGGWRIVNPDPNISVVAKTINGTADPAADGNAAAAGPGWPWVVNAGEVPIVTHDGSAYAFTGGAGSWGTTSGGTALGAGMFTALGAASQPPQVFDLTAQNAAADLGAAWNASGNTATSTTVLAAWNGAVHILVNTAAPGTAGSWQQISVAPVFATAAEVLAGTVADKSITPAGLQSRTLNAPTATPTNDANYLVRLNAQGHIDQGFINLPTVMSFVGAVDLAVAPVTPAGGWQVGDVLIHNGADHATVEGTWPGVAGDTVESGDHIIFDGTNFNLVQGNIDPRIYLPLSGGTMTDTAVISYDVPVGPAPAAPVVRLDGGDPLKSAIDNVTVNCGTY